MDFLKLMSFSKPQFQYAEKISDEIITEINKQKSYTYLIPIAEYQDEGEVSKGRRALALYNTLPIDEKESITEEFLETTHA